MKKKSLVLYALSHFLLFSNLVGATTLEQMTLSDLTQQSEKIVIGTVIAQESHWKNGGVETLVEVAVTDTLKGSESTSVRVAVAGGSAPIASNGIAVAEISADSPVFIQDSEVVLFLTGSSDVMQIVGYSQGFMPVLDQAAGKAVSLPNTTGPMPLEAFKDRVLTMQSN